MSLLDSQRERILGEGESTNDAIVEKVIQKAEKRRKTKREKAVSKNRSYKIPLDIERRETITNPPSIDVRGMIKIGEDVSERLMLDKAKFWVERTVRPIYKRKEGKQAVSKTIIQAPFKASILAGCIAGESLLSQIKVDKFLYHIPEYRQAKRFKELGEDITTCSINRWVHALADKLYPLYIA